MVGTQSASLRWSGSEEVRDARVLEALRQTPRHRFIPAALVPHAYEDRPLPIGYGQTISQPYIVAKMTELLEPKKEDRALEIGTGSGYQAAVLSPLVAEVDRKSTRLNSSHRCISYAVFCLKKKRKI